MDDSHPRSKRQKEGIMFDHVGGFHPILRRVSGMCLHVLLRENGFAHPAGKIAVAQSTHYSTCQCSTLSFFYESCWVLCLFGRNQQTSTLKRLKATCAWNILIPKCAQSQTLQTAGQSDFLQSLVEVIAKSQALQTAR